MSNEVIVPVSLFYSFLLQNNLREQQSMEEQCIGHARCPREASRWNGLPGLRFGGEVRR